MESETIFDWNKCALCQEDKDEPLQCPANSKRSDVGSGYKTLAANLQQFKELDSGILTTLFEVIDGEDIEKCFINNQARWHKNCSLQFNSTKLARARKHKIGSTQSPAAKRTRSSFASFVMSQRIKNHCTVLQRYLSTKEFVILLISYRMKAFC